MTWRPIAALAAACVLLLTRPVSADVRYTVTGMVVEADPSRRAFTASIDAIPGFMPAMTMPFAVRDAAELAGVGAGAMVTFTLVVGDTSSHAEGIRVEHYLNVEQDPSRAHRLALFREIASGVARRAVAAGESVPDFTLIDTRREPVTLSAFRGKVVAINFTYTTCQLPDYCLRIVNHFGALQRRFSAEPGQDVIFLTITFDPARDTPEVLEDYAGQWTPHADAWRFLTGPSAQLEPVLDMFGVVAFPAEGLIDHALRTVLIDREGRLIANLEGNLFTTDQLGDLIASAVD